ncbi:ABC-2 type transport system ATP-binding protein [Litoreibacter halocynthiae]|uniref:ABC-2 type transport system ATP-binding protein n=1 Tax=Litoreibacter halocynthiae TaxID=1242689 RepID=A0A4R7LNQ5_9RHOB|nr:ABC transporter ATP-binding protein [Litoreibacter halocynthiae]TDT77374.1 ABC-2 type transport system ATP-binding protein [Litoreibacter halocynthiae]
MTGLKVSNLSYHYGAKTALDEVSFELEKGKFCALLGPNGAGKSTLFNLLTRLFVSPNGQIEIAGHDLSRSPRKALAQLGIVFQQTTLDLDLTVRQNLSYFAALHGISGADATRRIDASLDRLGMLERADEKARTLNGGHKRRAEIARALIHNPMVLLLDEPTVGLDAAARASITSHVHDLTADGTTILWATHLTDEVRDDDRLIILHQARILADGTARDISGKAPLQSRFLNLTAATV